MVIVVVYYTYTVVVTHTVDSDDNEISVNTIGEVTIRYSKLITFTVCFD